MTARPSSSGALEAMEANDRRDAELPTGLVAVVVLVAFAVVGAGAAVALLVVSSGW